MTKRTKTVIAALCAAIAATGVIVALLPWAAESYRKAKKLPDEHGLYRIGSHIFEPLGSYNETGVAYFGKKLNRVRQELLTEDNKVYYALVPDKAYFVQDSGYPVYDYEAMQRTVKTALADWQRIDLTSALALDSYYATDPHWRQEKLFGVVKELGYAMDFNIDTTQFSPVITDGFIGGYARRAETAEQEALIYLTSEETEAASVENIETQDKQPVYNAAALKSKNAYDVYLGGAAAVQVMENPHAETDRELVLFRDSFGSSLAPLLLPAYSKITLVDLRYIATDLVKEYVEFTSQDVLFVYSYWVMNNAAMLR